jgi:hypothetical protein
MSSKGGLSGLGSDAMDRISEDDVSSSRVRTLTSKGTEHYETSVREHSSQIRIAWDQLDLQIQSVDTLARDLRTLQDFESNLQTSASPWLKNFLTSC